MLSYELWIYNFLSKEISEAMLIPYKQYGYKQRIMNVELNRLRITLVICQWGKSILNS